jgi:hypothetical protein
VLDQHHAFPQQVDVTVLAVELLDAALEAGESAARDAEDGEELVPEGLGLGVLGFDVLPVAREAQGAVLDLVPA